MLKLVAKVMPLNRIIARQHGCFAVPKRPEYDPVLERFNRAFDACVDAGELRRAGLRHSVELS